MSVPRHYWNTSVEWCDTKIGSAGDKWLGYGTDLNGTCQAGYDATHIYPRFYQFGVTGYVDNYANAAFQRVDLDITQRGSASYTTTWIDAGGQQQTITRSFDEEMTNYANWFAYYRTRIQAVKTVTSLVFNNLDDKYQRGPRNAVQRRDPRPRRSRIRRPSSTSRPSMRRRRHRGSSSCSTSPFRCSWQTPTLNAMTRIGDYFLNGSSAVLTGATDPIVLSCQKNWHMLFTDGFVNQPGLPATTVGDQDLTVPAYPDMATNPIPGMVAGQAWPHPYQEDPNNTAADSQSDYAMYYWITDLRTSGPNATDNVPTSSTDPASWQHLNFAALSLGTQGKLPASNPSLTMNQLAAGTLLWPQPYPTVWHPDNSGVDDLWHAAVNGRGQFVNANSAAQLQLGMGQILQNITNQAGSRSAAGFSTNSISATNNSIYRVSFQPGWGGSVAKIPVDPTTGLSGAPDWDAATQLGAQLVIASPGDTPWFTNRKVFTVNDSEHRGAVRVGEPVGCAAGFARAGAAGDRAERARFPARRPDQRRHLDRAVPGARHLSPRARTSWATSSTRRRSTSGRPTPPTRTPTTPATRALRRPRLRVRRWCTSVPMTACCTRSTTAAATKAGPSCRTTCTARTTPDWARCPTRMARCHRSGITTMSTRHRG